MQTKIPPAFKGVITAVLMIATILIIYYSGKPVDTRFQYLVYIFYSLGIAWTLFDYRRSVSFVGKFGEIFGQGFKCFIVVTLIMSLFYGVFNYMHPEFAEEMASAYKKQLEEMVGKNQKMPSDIESAVTTYKKQYTLKLVSAAIFGYLIIGAVITAVVSALLTRRK